MTGSRIQAHSSNTACALHVTKVLTTRAARVAFCLAVLFISAIFAEDASNRPAESLYLQLSHVGLDPARVYQVRGASLNRRAIQITLEDGTIAFTQDIMGRVTGAFFEGYGEILLTPPDEVERRSITLFTGMAILEERFETAYFRFDDDVPSELAPDLRQTSAKQEFVDHWNASARELAATDAMRLLVHFSRLLPTSDKRVHAATDSGGNDHFLHARLQGTKLGVFDVLYDSTAAEKIQAGQVRNAENGTSFYDVWTSFSPLEQKSSSHRGLSEFVSQEDTGEPLKVNRYRIVTDVEPPHRIHAIAKLQVDVEESGSRALLFELSRFLTIESVKVNGKAVEFIHNPALEGTRLSRQGNDIVAVILPDPATPTKDMELEFDYGGEVLAEAGPGLLYVGARGTWYPNRGMQLADFDLEFNYPQGWTLLATGKPAQAPNERASPRIRSRWISERPIPLAGFNLGKYREATAQAGTVKVQAYATQNVEKDFPTAHIEVIDPHPPEPALIRPPAVMVPSRPSPAQNAEIVAQTAARAVDYFAARFGPFPYSDLFLTQLPGRDSQGWPGLVFLSSYAFLNNEEREQLHFAPYRILIEQSIPAHETAHQWWGDLVGWSSYRDQWLSEALANYSAFMTIQEKDPAAFQMLMDRYRTELMEKNPDGIAPMEAGPVTLGTRLVSSHFPNGYSAISYGRGTWLIHMLRMMLNDAAAGTSAPSQLNVDEPFVRALRKVRDRYQGRSISTEELLGVFAEDLPSSLRYEGKKSLQWFLDGWVNGTSIPKLELKNVKIVTKGTGVTVSGTILQKDAPADLVTSIPIYGVVSGKASLLLGRVFADGEESSFRLSAPAGTHKILLDPNETVLKNSQ